MKTKRIFSFLLGAVVLTAMFSFVAAQEPNRESWKKFVKDFSSPGLHVVWDEETGVPSLIKGMEPVSDLRSTKTVTKEEISAGALAFLKKYKELFKVPADAIRLKNIKYYRDKWYVTYQTFYKQIPISGGQVGFTLDQNGNILTYASDYNPMMELNTEPGIAREDAVRIARRLHRPAANLPVEVKDAHLTIQKEVKAGEKQKYRLVWHVFLGTRAGHLDVDRVFLIDAMTGEKIFDYFPHPSAITGTVQGETYPVHSTDAVATVPFEHLTVSVPGFTSDTNAAGNYSLNPAAGTHTLTMKLEGPFVRVQSYNSGTATDQDIQYSASVTNPSVHIRTWTASNSAPDDGDGLNVFWHANRLHDDYYQAVVGINWNNSATGTSVMNYSVNRGNINNAFAGNPITLYSDAISRNCDITYHESSHNVLVDIFGGSYIGWPSAYSEGYAFDEGFADYVACSFNNDSIYAENVHATRNCNNTMQYPGTTYNIEGHTGGQLVSGMAWDLWNKLGLNHNDTDVLLFEGLFQMATTASPYYFSDPSHSNFLTSLLTADDTNNNVSDGTPHDRQIFQAFRYHDMLPVDVFCKDSPQDDGNVPSLGYCWTSPDIWVRHAQDDLPGHLNPRYNQDNYIYVKVRTLGYLTATTITVKVYWADPAGGIPWPTDWNLIGQSSISNLAAGGVTDAPAIYWKPTGTAIGHRCLLVRLECSQDMITEEGSVKNDNNIAQLNVDIKTVPSGPPTGLWSTKFFLRDFGKARMDLVVKVRRTDKPVEILERAMPFTVEVKMPKLVGFSEAPEFTYRKNAGCFFQKLLGKKEHRFLLKEREGRITGIRFADREKVLNKIQFTPMASLEPGAEYEVTLIQEVNGEAVGGLTYLIRVKGK